MTPGFELALMVVIASGAIYGAFLATFVFWCRRESRIAANDSLIPTCADVADDVAAIDAELMERLNEREGI